MHTTLVGKAECHVDQIAERVAGWLRDAAAGRSVPSGHEEFVNCLVAEANRLVNNSPLTHAFREGAMGWTANRKVGRDYIISVARELQQPALNFLASLEGALEEIEKAQPASTSFTNYVDEHLRPAVQRVRHALEACDERKQQLLATKAK